MNRNNYNYFWKTLNPKQGLPAGPHWSVRGPAQPQLPHTVGMGMATARHVGGGVWPVQGREARR